MKPALPAVVYVFTRGTETMRYLTPFGFRTAQRESRSLGSGVIVDAAKGLILTNHHVIANADAVSVQLDDGRHLTAKVVGSDEPTDLAVLKIEAKGLTALPLGDSDDLEIGDYVIAIGNPYGYDHSVTSGIVSGLGRRSVDPDVLGSFIQTDAALNSGNSGGALINIRGELVGISDWRLPPLANGEVPVNIGFAIPVNIARGVMQQLIANGAVQRGMLGVQAADLPSELATEMGVAAGAGAAVSSITANSAAAKAGIQPGDVIVAIDGKPVGGAADLRNRIGLLRAGQAVKVSLVRDGKPREVVATLTKFDPDNVPVTEAVHPKLAGAQFSEIDERSPFYGRLKGVLVAAVEPTSNAARRAGLQPGDVITGVGRKPVANLGEFRRVMAGLDADAVFALNIRRGNYNIFTTVP